MSTPVEKPESFESSPLSIAVISPDTFNRDQAIASLARFANGTIREFVTYPPGAGAVAEALRQDFDVVIIDLDSDPDYALQLVENISIDGSTNVIVYSAKPDPAVLMRCMRAGAREFLPIPVSIESMTEALLRVSARRIEVPAKEATRRSMMQESRGKLLVFMSAKGGAGVTTIASGLAISLAQEFGERVLLIDLSLPMGDAALTLGLKSEFSTVNALNNFHRLDGSLLNSLIVRHDSGLHVLPAPSDITAYRFENDAVFKLLRVARQEFDYVIVDGGSRFEAHDAYMVDDTAEIFLVTQIGVSELRNSNRLVKQLVVDGGPKVEIVINRFDSDASEIDDYQIKKALTQPIRWKIPNDYAAVRRTQNLGQPLNKEDSQIARTIREMAESICGKSPAPKHKKRFGFF